MSDSILILKIRLPKGLKLGNTIKDIKLKSNLKSIQTLKFTEKTFFYTILGFTESH